MTPSASIRCPLLETVLQGLDTDRRVFVIDLGGLRAATLEALSSYRCRLDVLDLDLGEFVAAPEFSDLSFQDCVAAFEGRLPELDGEQADLLLCWGYLNYFALDQLSALMPVLCRRLNTVGQVHALIESSARSMPAAPRALSIARDGGVLWPPESTGEAVIPTPRHASDGLLRCLPGFALERTMLLANGQKEFLFRRS